MINDSDHMEYFKWQICREFPQLMKEALTAPDDDFSKKLNAVQRCTDITIDNYTQPFYGLVQCAREEPGTVRKMFQDLYVNDGNDLTIRMEKIADFFGRSKEVLKKCFPGSFLYKQNSHSVSAYLFFNDPDNHYMYKATQSKNMADCVEFFDDWGSGDNIDLAKYHRMCDEILAEIKNSPELLATNNSLFDGRLNLVGGPLYPDTEKHILLFDIIYCCNVYDLFDGISYNKLTLKEKQLYQERRAKAQEIKDKYDQAGQQLAELETAIAYFSNAFKPGDHVRHKTFGDGIVRHISEKYITVEFPDREEEKKFGLSSVVGLGTITADIPEYKEKAAQYKQIMLNEKKIVNTQNYLASQLEEYEEFL